MNTKKNRGAAARRRAGAVVSLVVLGAGMTLGGCKSVPKAEYDAAIEENTELRERIATLQETVRQANEQSGSLQRENDTLNSRLAKAESDLSSERNRAPSSGFEGIPGVSVGTSGQGEVVVAVEGDVLFASGSAELRREARSSLDRVARVLGQRYKGQMIRVEGYTDTDPIKKSKWRSNEHLSAERALSVEKYLVKSGVSNGRIYSAAFGPASPKGSKQASRRVEIVILGT